MWDYIETAGIAALTNYLQVGPQDYVDCSYLPLDFIFVFKNLNDSEIHVNHLESRNTLAQSYRVLDCYGIKLHAVAGDRYR